MEVPFSTLFLQLPPFSTPIFNPLQSAPAQLSPTTSHTPCPSFSIKLRARIPYFTSPVRSETKSAKRSTLNPAKIAFLRTPYVPDFPIYHILRLISNVNLILFWSDCNPPILGPVTLNIQIQGPCGLFASLKVSLYHPS